MASRGKASGPGTTDSIDIAMSRARNSDQARELLTSQSHLIFTQELLARADLRHRGWQIIGERVGALLKIMTALVGLLLLVGVVWFLWSAQRANGMVVDPFAVPRSMEQRGLTGSVVAGQLLDKVAALENGTQSARASSSYEISWSNSKGVEVPYTGVSLSQLRREARDWLGSEQHLSGDVVQIGGDRVAINFRTGRSAGRVEGDERDFNALMDQAAQSIFKATQPYRYAVWLSRNGGHVEDMRATFTQLLRSPDLRDRLWAMHGLAVNVVATDAERVALYRRALRLQPDFLPAVGNLPFYALNAGREEEAYQRFVASAVAYSAGQEDYSPAHALGYGLTAQAHAAELKGDRLRAAQLWTETIEHSADVSNTAFRPFTAAWAWSRAHDFATARAPLAAAGYLDPASRAEVEARIGAQESPRLLTAYASDDFATQATELTALIANYQRAAAAAADPAGRTSNLQVVSGLRPVVAAALARSGRVRGAEAVIAPMPQDHDAALRTRALIAAYAGHFAASDALFARAAARTPSLPAANTLWAEVLLRRGDLPRAIEKAQLASRAGPQSADPLMFWGDALMAQGKAFEAEGRYALAATHAPHWGKLHLKWAAALWRKGDRGPAVARLAEASRMDLNPADRALLRTMWRNARRLD